MPVIEISPRVSSYLSTIGTKGGSSTSKAKVKAARRNVAKARKKARRK